MKKTSAYARKRRHASIDPLAGLRLLDSCRPYDPSDITGQHILSSEALARLKDGTASDADFDRVAMAINVAKIRALEIDGDLADLIESAQAAMTEVRARHERIGRWGFTALQLDAVAQAMDAQAAIYEASSPMQMQRALDAVSRVILKRMKTEKKQ